MVRQVKKSILRGAASAGNQIGWAFNRATRLETCRRILIFQGGGLGDIFRAFPLILSLRQQFPKTALYTLTPFFNTVFKLFPKPDLITESFNYSPAGEHRGLSGKWRLIKQLRPYRFDLIVNPARGEGMIENTILSYLIGAPFRIGFEKKGAGFLNSVKVPLQDDRPIVEQNLDLLRAVGIPISSSLPIRVPDEERPFGIALRKEILSKGDRLFAFHPGSFWRKELQWPLSRYIGLAKEILQRYRCGIVLLGTKEEAPLAEQIQNAVGSPRLISMAGKTTLTQAASLIQSADLFIGNDSGLLHLSLGLRVPTIGLFGYTDPRQVIAPEGLCIALHKASGEALYLHQPFYQFDPEESNPIERIEVEEVVEAVKSLIDMEGLHSFPSKTF
jgi:ADP-heptose:LPS heptosyltransferase